MAKLLFSIFCGALLCCYATLGLAQSCTGEVLNVSAPTHSTSGTTANWAVPSGGPYKVRITAKGAMGGSAYLDGGGGAKIEGLFIVSGGQILQAIAGAPGQSANGGGGGGGSGVRLMNDVHLIIAGGGGGATDFDFGNGGASSSGSGNGGAGVIAAGGGGLLSSGGNGWNGATGGGFGFAGSGGNSGGGGGKGGGGYGGGGGGLTTNVRRGGGGGGFSGGGGAGYGGIGITGGGGGDSYNLGTNQNNTSGANNAGGQVIIECLGTATLTATATATQPVCATSTQGSASIDLTGDLNGYTSGGLEYAVVSGGAFSGSPTFADVLADPFSITSGTGTVADLDGETYTVRVRLKYNPTLFVDVTYTLTRPCNCTFYVKADASGVNDGSSWANAYADLQSALAAACSGAEIWVAAGTYKPTTGTNRGISFSMKNGVGIYGGFPGIPGQEGNFSVRDWAANPTILSGDIDGVPDVITGSGSTLSITGNGGNSFHVILNDNNGLTTTNSLLDGFTITGGNADDNFRINPTGGGMCNRNASPSLRNLTFLGNNAFYFGGGIYNETSSPNLTNVTFFGNSASSNGGSAGGGMANLSSYPNLTNVVFYGNNSSNFGGGMININALSPVILTNVTFAGNNAGNEGGAIFNSFTSAIIKNSIFWKNTISSNANTVGADISNNGGNSVFPTSATVSNTALQFAISAYTYNFPNIATNSNLFTQDPLFVNAAAGNLHLQACSPAIDAGSNAALPADVTTDLEGNARRYNAGTVDMGAYESQTGFPGNPAEFGSNAWHVYVWKSGNASIPNSAAWNENYAGYYVDNNLNINTPDRWPASGSPSQASGYTGCAVENDFFSFSCKRKGFPPGSYLLNVPNHDDAADLWVNGSKVWEHNGCCDAHANVWSGNLGATDFVEFRVTEGNGGSIGILDFAICPSNGIAYVNAAATGANNGTSWVDAYTDLQSALNSSCPGITEIWVTAGTYKPTTGTNRGISFSMKNGVGIYGGFAGTETLREQRNWTTNATVLSGDIGIAGDNSDNTHHVIRNSGLNNSSILDGFTISGGRTPESFSYDGRGGGMYNDGASPMIRNCIFTGNVARTYGGGMENIYSNPIVTNCVFTGNSAGGNGTGMHNDSGSPTLINCTMSNNLGYGAIATNSSGAVATLTNCIVMGGIYETNGGSATVRYCISEDPFNGIGNLGADPLFVDAANGDFRLQACSPAIDAGTDTGVPTTDFDGNARVDAISGGSVTDIGAYEYQSTAPVPTALCKTFTAYLSANGTAVMVSASDINNGSGDNTCGPVTLSINGQTSVTYTCSDLGQRTATLTVASAKSNRSATCQTTVTLLDNTKPTITCPANTTLALGGNCSASLPAYALATKSDNCAASGSIGEWQSPEAGTPVSGHNTAQTVVLTANDGNGNTETCQFTVTLLDNTKPAITCPANTTIILDGNCSADLPAYALATKSDNCAASGNIGEWQSPEAGTPVSGHNTAQTVVLTANDGNGNTETCQFTVTLLDNTKPTITCPANTTLALDGNCSADLPAYALATKSDNCAASGSIGEWQSPEAGTPVSGHNTAQTVVLTANDGNGNTETCQFTVTMLDNTVPSVTCKPASLYIIGTGTATLVPEAVFLSGSDNCSPVTLVSVSPNSFGTNQLGQQTVVLTVRDAANNTATCTAEVQISRNVSGRIIWKQDQSTGVKDATVTLNGNQSGNMTTAANGNYGFTLANGSNFTITPSKNLNKMNGINAQDVQRIQQHLSGNPIVNPWQMLAADVNSSNSITALDANILQLAILGNPSALAQMPKSWRFVPAGYALSNPPWGCPEQLVVNPSTANFDFYGVKVGDMVATYANPANASAQPLLLTAQDQLLEAGQVLTIDLHTGALRDLNALQFALHFDPEQLQLSGVESLDALPLTSEHLGIWQAAEGSLRILWSDVQSRGLAAGAPLLRLRFAVVEGGARLSEVLQLDEAALPGLVFTSAGASAGVALRYDAATATKQPVVVGLALQNYPNPFTGHTTVRFELPEACEAQLRITNATGRLIAEHGATYGAGRHEWRFELPVSAGVLYCELKTPFGALTQKMIVVE